MNQDVRRIPSCRARRGFTLIEVTMTLLVMSVVLIATGSVIALSAKAATAALKPADARAAASDAADRIMAELQYATSVSEMTSQAVTFTVADRNNDGSPETIRYAWSGLAGSPLTRSYNGGTPLNVGSGLSTFVLSYTQASQTSNTTTSNTSTSAETLLSGFSGWTGITPTNRELALSTATIGSEYFKLDRVSMPAGTTSIAITRVRFMARSTTGNTGTITVGIYSPASGQNYPSSTTTPIGSTSALAANTLGTTQAWVSVPMNVTLQPTQTSLCLGLKGSAASTAFIRYYDSTLAPTDSQVMQWTTNGGSTWMPTTKLYQYDMPYEVYGTITSTTTSTASITTYTLTQVDVSMKPTGSSTPLISSVRLLNAPSVTGP